MTGGREHICIIRHDYSNFLTLTLKNTLTTFLNVFVPAGRIPRTPPLLKKSTDAAARFFTSLRFTSPQGLLHFLSFFASFFLSFTTSTTSPSSILLTPTLHPHIATPQIHQPAYQSSLPRSPTYIHTNEVLYITTSD